MKKLLISIILLSVSMSASAANILATDFVGRVTVGGVPQQGKLVVLHHKETNRTLRAYTNNKGRYHFANVRPDGMYTITYEGKTIERKPQLGKTLQQNF